MNENDTSIRIWQNRRKMYVMLLLWVIVFILGRSMPVDAKKHKRDTDKNNSSNVEPRDRITSLQSTGVASCTNTNANIKNENTKMLQKFLLCKIENFVISFK